MHVRRTATAALTIAGLGTAGGIALASPYAPHHPASAPAVAEPAASHASIGTRHSGSLGTFLVNARTGRTLYLFERDRRNKSRCFSSCATFWPPLMTQGRAHATGGAKQGKLGRIRRGSSWQVTYNRHPLYTYGGDNQAGQTNGQGLEAFGAEWFVVSPRGRAVH